MQIYLNNKLYVIMNLVTIIKTPLILFWGADLLMVTIFEVAVVLTSQFHHSSLKVPEWFEYI